MKTLVLCISLEEANGSHDLIQGLDLFPLKQVDHLSFENYLMEDNYVCHVYCGQFELLFVHAVLVFLQLIMYCGLPFRELQQRKF